MTNEQRLNKIVLEYERKLAELMPDDEYWKYITGVAQKLFREEIDEMADGEFKDFVLENYRNIVGGVE